MELTVKKLLLFSALIVVLFVSDISAQAVFNSGKIELTLRTYGRIRISTLDSAGLPVRQLDRGSLLYYMSDTLVYDYLEDSDDIIAPDTVENPTWGDVELISRVNSNYVPKAPSLEEEVHMYGWNNKGYALVKFTVKSLEAASYQGRFGMEMIPMVEGAYGNEVMTYDVSKKLFSFSKTNYFGLKILNYDVPSAHNFEWFDGYQVDSLLSKWMTNGEYSTYHWAGIDGGTAIFGTTPITTNPGDSVVLYIAVACGVDSVEMNLNIDSAAAKYHQLTSIEDQSPVAPITDYKVYQNYPNPFNPSTVVRYALPVAGYITLDVYNLLGEKVAQLVNGMMPAGNHEVKFDASKLSSGIYFYTLRAEGNVITNKMILSK
jgi:hypothetical protein